MGKPCVAGCGALGIDYGKQEMKAGGKTFKRGDELTIDGSTGAVIAGTAPTVQPEVGGMFGTLLGWGDEIAKLYVRANADTPKDAEAARKFGAKGIGLCRTEHMFFGADRIKAMREMILADSMEDKKKALAKVLPYQKQDFIGIFKAMEGLPVTIRLFDPPLHEFLPQTDDAMSELAKEMGIPVEKIAARARTMHEANPMLGHRGCRLGITNPEITEMQARAIMEAACELTRQGVKVIPEIMVPLVTMLSEFNNQKKLIVKVAEETQEKYGVKVEYTVGTMIETPRAALAADEIAKDADFFSFGTNDLTQMTFGFSRDDAERFLPYYIDKGIISANPFMILDQSGVGQLVKMGTERGRKTKPGLKVGICGEHGGEPSSVKFCHRVGMNYVSCSPFRVPIARLALAHAALEEELGAPTRQ
jgi:pyruvate,orthophosphate dikinase